MRKDLITDACFALGRPDGGWLGKKNTFRYCSKCHPVLPLTHLRVKGTVECLTNEYWL